MPSTDGPRPRTSKATSAGKRRAAAPRVPPDPLEEGTTATAADDFNYWDQPAPSTPPPFDANRTLGEWLNSLVPPEAQVHFLNAGREFALGVQVTLDHHSGRVQPERPRSTHIDIE